jgi:hypothetical protein
MITNSATLKDFCKWFNGKQYKLSHETILLNFKYGNCGDENIKVHILMYISEYNSYYPGSIGKVSKTDVYPIR